MFVAGYVPSPQCCSSVFVRAYVADTGRVLWTDVYNKGRDDLPQAIAASSAAVVVAGYGGNTRTPPIGGLDFLVRAYEPGTGSVLWEDRVDSGFDIDDAAWAVTTDANRVFVAGTSSTSSEWISVFVRAYDAASGTLLWATQLPGMPPKILLNVDDGVLYVSGPGGAFPLNTTNGEPLD